MNAPRFLSDEYDCDLLARATQYLPGTSAWMWSLPPELAFIVERGEGSRVYATRGRAYGDYVMGSGPLLLGHAHPAVVQAVQAQVAKGSTYFWLSEPTVRLAELICKAVPCGEKNDRQLAHGRSPLPDAGPGHRRHPQGSHGERPDRPLQ